MLHVIDHLLVDFVLGGRPCVSSLLAWLLTHGALFALSGVLVTESRKLYPVRDRIPLHVEHRMDRLDFDPPVSLLESVADEP